MLENTQRIRLDICDNQTYEQIYTKQYNKGFPIEFEITKNGKPFSLSGIITVFELKKPDERFVVEYGNIQDNIISVNITDQMTTTDGKAKFQITLFDAESYNSDNKNSAIIISTVTGTMKIDKSTVQNEDIEASKDVFNIISEVLIKIEDAKLYAQNAEEYMNKSLEYSNNSKVSATASANSASAAKTSENNAKTYASNAKTSETNAKTSETNALSSANSASSSANSASTSASNAKTSETQAKTSENNAKTYASNAKTSETNAKTSETNASSSATSASTSASNAKESETNASASANTAITKANEASVSATNASKSESNAKNYATNASSSATSASTSASTAMTKADEAKTSASNAKTYATNASNSATSAQNYATGSTNSAKYYYEQAKTISESFSGALRPMGTVTFANLPSISSASEGDMYNISDEFTTTSDFKEGSGTIIAAGSNVYKTFDGFWDILAGTPVVGIKGNSEVTYRRGNVNITASDIGFEIVSETEPSNQEIGCYWLEDY